MSLFNLMFSIFYVPTCFLYGILSHDLPSIFLRENFVFDVRFWLGDGFCRSCRQTFLSRLLILLFVTRGCSGSSSSLRDCTMIPPLI